MAEDFPSSPQHSQSQQKNGLWPVAGRLVRQELRRVLPNDRSGELRSEIRACPGGGTLLYNTAMAAVENEHHSGRGSNYDMWKAAKNGNEKALKNALEANADFNYELTPDDHDEDSVLTYKNRKVTSQAIHAASLYPSCSKSIRPEERARLDETYDARYDNKALACVKLLVEAGAEVKTKARITEGKTTRELEAIHMAAGAGNAKTLEYLIKQNADPNAQALVNKMPHYYPIHDAVWFNRKECVKMLLLYKAEAAKKNNDGNTALHLAARMGHDDLVKFLLYDRHREEGKEKEEDEDDFLLGRVHSVDDKERQREAKKSEDAWRSAMKESYHLVKRTNNNDEEPLTVAVERGHFPADQLYLFTRCFDSLDAEAAMAGRVQAFKKVAMTCPDAAPKLVRDYQRTTSCGDGEDEPLRAVDLKNTEISKEWKESIIAGAEKGMITVKDLCDLIDHAPSAAVDLLDMLTTAPKEENKQHNPLPVRANIPWDQEACRLSCVYIEDKKWTWKNKVTMPWQEKLAPQDAKRSQEVKVKMLMLPGVINSFLTHSLAATRDHKIFTKLVVHAMLKHLWKSFRPVFLVDLGHQFLSTAVLSYWILIAAQVETPRMMRCGLWGILAAEGISECFMFIWTCIICKSRLGRRLFVRYVKREYYRFVMGSLALALAIETSTHFEPAQNSSILLSINSLVHWITMLFEIRAFRSTGKRILPIMKSVLPIVGMLVIMLFISLAFMHAFWAMDRAGINEISMFNIVVLLFTGEQFLSPEDLLEMPQSKRTAMVLLSIGGVFIFLTCTINVFIAVLSDCYDHEQERMVCTFLKERARICSSYFFRPKIKASGFGFIQKGIMKLSWWRWWFLIVLIPGIYVALLYGITESSFLTLWVSAIFPAAAVLCVQCILRDVASVGWKTNYLWFCHEVDIEEESLAPEQRDEEESNGRISRIKKYIKTAIKSCEQNIQTLSLKVEGLHKTTANDLDAIREILFKEVSIPRCADLPTPKFPGRRARINEGCEEQREAASFLLEAQDPDSEEVFGAPSPSGIPGMALMQTMRMPEPPTHTHPRGFEDAIPSKPPPTPKLCQRGGEFRGGERGGVGMQQDLEALKQDVCALRDSFEERFEELKENVEEQRDTCQEIQRLLERVVELAETRHSRKTRSSTRGAASNAEGSEAPAAEVHDAHPLTPRVPRETMSAYGRSNDVPTSTIE